MAVFESSIVCQRFCLFLCLTCWQWRACCVFPATGSQRETKMMTDVSRLHSTTVLHPLTQTADRHDPINHQARLTAQGSVLKKAVISWHLCPKVSSFGKEINMSPMGMIKLFWIQSGFLWKKWQIISKEEAWSDLFVKLSKLNTLNDTTEFFYTKCFPEMIPQTHMFCTVLTFEALAMHQTLPRASSEKTRSVIHSSWPSLCPVIHSSSSLNNTTLTKCTWGACMNICFCLTLRRI